MKKNLIILAILTFLFQNAQAGDVFGLSQSVLKIISESREVKQQSENLAIEEIVFLDKDISLPHGGTYKITLGRYDEARKNCLLVTLNYLGSGRHEITEVESCNK